MSYYEVTRKWEKESHSIYTNHLIVLCSLGTEYKSFCNDLEQLIVSKKSKDLVQDAYDVMQGKFSIRARLFKEFVEKHKQAIELMNEYSCLSNLTLLSYDVRGQRRTDLGEDYFYEYLQQHKDDIAIIRQVALRLKQLGFEKIYFGENIDFTKYSYEMDDSYGSDVAILENMKSIPIYLSDSKKYTTTNSRYCLTLSTSGFGENKTLSKYGNKVFLNNLAFNPQALPSELTIENTLDLIRKASKETEPQHIDIRDSIDITIATDDLRRQFEYVQRVSTKSNFEDNKKLKDILTRMQAVIGELQSFNEEFEGQVIEKNNDVTKDTMNKEKELYLRRREWASIDID